MLCATQHNTRHSATKSPMMCCRWRCGPLCTAANASVSFCTTAARRLMSCPGPTLWSPAGVWQIEHVHSDHEAEYCVAEKIKLAAVVNARQLRPRPAQHSARHGHAHAEHAIYGNIYLGRTELYCWGLAQAWYLEVAKIARGSRGTGSNTTCSALTKCNTSRTLQFHNLQHHTRKTTLGDTPETRPPPSDRRR